MGNQFCVGQLSIANDHILQTKGWELDRIRSFQHKSLESILVIKSFLSPGTPTYRGFSSIDALCFLHGVLTHGLSPCKRADEQIGSDRSWSFGLLVPVYICLPSSILTFSSSESWYVLVNKLMPHWHQASRPTSRGRHCHLDCHCCCSRISYNWLIIAPPEAMCFFLSCLDPGCVISLAISDISANTMWRGKPPPEEAARWSSSECCVTCLFVVVVS